MNTRDENQRLLKNRFMKGLTFLQLQYIANELNCIKVSKMKVLKFRIFKISDIVQELHKHAKQKVGNLSVFEKNNAEKRKKGQFFVFRTALFTQNLNLHIFFGYVCLSKKFILRLRKSSPNFGTNSEFQMNGKLYGQRFFTKIVFF